MTSQPRDRLAAALAAPESSTRLQAALSAGTHPRDEYLEPLVARSALEPDFFVREMLTWALTRLSPEPTVDRLLVELASVFPQARSQALHTLSKIGDARVAPAIGPALLRDDEVEVARAAWRTAARLTPAEGRAALATELATQFGRGDRETRSSLTRAFAMLADDGRDAVAEARRHPDLDVRVHALATERILDDPEEGFEQAQHEARRVVARETSEGPA